MGGKKKRNRYAGRQALAKNTTADNNVAIVTSSGYLTLCYSEKSTGWVSLFSYKPTFGTSLSNKFYTFNKHNLFKHYDPSTQRNNFYNSTYKDPSYVDVVMNDQPSVIKNFLTINQSRNLREIFSMIFPEFLYLNRLERLKKIYQYSKVNVDILLAVMLIDDKENHEYFIHKYNVSNDINCLLYTSPSPRD